MCIQIETQIFHNALGKVISILDKKNRQPLLAYSQFKFLVTDQLEISATDLEISALIAIEVKGVKKFQSFCVNAKNLFDILKGMPTQNISFNLIQKENERHVLHVENIQKDIHYSLKVYSDHDYPHLNFKSTQNHLILSSKNILDMINKTSHAISHDDTRPYLKGIFIQEIKDKIRVVSTDGHRLALYEINSQATHFSIFTNGIIIPKKGIQELKKIAEFFPKDDLSLSFDDSFMYIVAGNSYKLSIRLITSEYPKYQSVIPDKTNYSIRVVRDHLLMAIKRIKIMSNEKSNGMKLSLNKNEIVLQANHPSFGDAKETMNIDYDGEFMEIGFNAQYIIDVLTVLDEKEIFLELNDELSPVVIKSSSSNSFLGIVMPLKL